MLNSYVMSCHAVAYFTGFFAFFDDVSILCILWSFPKTALLFTSSFMHNTIYFHKKNIRHGAVNVILENKFWRVSSTTDLRNCTILRKEKREKRN